MPYFEYTWLASTYRPPELGHAEIEILSIFAHNESQSVYGIFKENKKRAELWHRERSSAYKDVHKRVKRLAQLKLVDQIKEHFERGAKHYRITPYGLITYLDNIVSDDHRYIFHNKENTVIQSLLLEFLEEETIDSFHLLKEFPTADIGEYLHECCSITADICKEFWTKFQRYNITDILPTDDTIQKYMSYLDGKPVDQHILDEIKEYKKRLMAKLDNNNESDKKELTSAVDGYNKEHFSPDAIRDYERSQSIMPYNRNYLEERPPFPLLNIFYDLAWMLSIRLEQKTKLLAFNLVSQLGEMITNSKIESQDRLEDFLEKGRDYSLRHVLKDKRFIELVRAVKKEFDIGYKQFLYYH
jgi:hypothetical protein